MGYMKGNEDGNDRKLRWFEDNIRSVDETAQED